MSKLLFSVTDFWKFFCFNHAYFSQFYLSYLPESGPLKIWGQFPPWPPVRTPMTGAQLNHFDWGDQFNLPEYCIVSKIAWI